MLRTLDGGKAGGTQKPGEDGVLRTLGGVKTRGCSETQVGIRRGCSEPQVGGREKMLRASSRGNTDGYSEP